MTHYTNTNNPIDFPKSKSMMNERIRQLAEQAGMTDDKFGMFFAEDFDSHCADGVDLEKFAELIVRECIEQVRAVGNLRGANDDMIYGVDTAAIRLSKHFGVEE